MKTHTIPFSFVSHVSWVLEIEKWTKWPGKGSERFFIRERLTFHSQAFKHTNTSSFIMCVVHTLLVDVSRTLKPKRLRTIMSEQEFLEIKKKPNVNEMDPRQAYHFIIISSTLVAENHWNSWAPLVSFNLNSDWNHFYWTTQLNWDFFNYLPFLIAIFWCIEITQFFKKKISICSG